MVGLYGPPGPSTWGISPQPAVPFLPFFLRVLPSGKCLALPLATSSSPTPSAAQSFPDSAWLISLAI